jgi:hypothetical protein
VFALERTAAGEHIAVVLDVLPRREMGGSGFTAALAATLDGAGCLARNPNFWARITLCPPPLLL